jgi:hypothetical protein
VITDYIWRQDSENLTQVWNSLSRMNIAPDARRQLWEAWRVYMQAPVPEDLEDMLEKSKDQLERDEKASPTHESKEDRAKARGWIVDDDGPQWVGTNLGNFTLGEAKDLYTVRSLRQRHTPTETRGNSGSGDVAAILTALQPYLKSDSNQELVTKLMEEQIRGVEDRITRAIPIAKEAPSIQSRVQEVTSMLSALQGAAPIIRGLLGIPDLTMIQRPASESQAIQLLNSDGTPMQMNLDTLFSLKKFEREERQADEAHKNKMEMGTKVKEFMTGITNAATKFASGK